MTEKNKQLLSDFLRVEKQHGRTKQTLIGFRTRVPWLLNWLEEVDLLPAELRARDALAYQGWLQEKRTKDGRKYSAYAITAYLVAAACFCDYLQTRGIIHTNPFKEIRRIKAPRKLPRHIPKEKELHLFLETLACWHEEETLKRRITRYKVHVVAELMYATGLRISEVAALKLADIDFQRGLVHVREGKGGSPRVAMLNEYAREVLRLYVQKMRSLIFSEWNERNADLLFGVQWGWFGKLVNRVLQETAAAAGLQPFTAHTFRHALGFHLLRAGCNIRHIQSILGHKLLRNTEIYTRVDKDDLREVLDKFHPRQWRRTVDEQTDTGEGR